MFHFVEIRRQVYIASCPHQLVAGIRNWPFFNLKLNWSEPGKQVTVSRKSSAIVQLFLAQIIFKWPQVDPTFLSFYRMSKYMLITSSQGWVLGPCPLFQTGILWPPPRPSRGHSQHSPHFPPGHQQEAAPILACRELHWPLATMGDTLGMEEEEEAILGAIMGTVDIQDTDTTTTHFRVWLAR